MDAYDRTERLILIGVVVGMTLLAGILAYCIYAGIDATREDREWRAKRADACRTVEDQAMRTLCLVKGP